MPPNLDAFGGNRFGLNVENRAWMFQVYAVSSGKDRPYAAVS